MNTITLNGVRSDTIQGLLIQSLPPISKPPIRVNVEEIDGRNGDIITDLGYQAYDKTFTIGLRGSFDINDVISFFNSAGTVVFSNEPDKYYRYKIYQQIDFERLIRFRVANVTMHVQPFKYPLNESPISVSSLTWEGTDYDQTPYIFRAVSDSSVEVGNREVIEQITGGTIAFNQLMKNGNFEDESVWAGGSSSNVTFSVKNNVGTVTALSDGNRFKQNSFNMNAVVGHKYLFTVDAQASVTPTSQMLIVSFFYGNASSRNRCYTTDNNWHTYIAILACTAMEYNMIRLEAPLASIPNNFKNAMVIDLTQMFGTTIADYIYSLETATAGAGVSLFKSLFPKDYYAYNAGELESVKTSARETVGKNLLDPVGFCNASIKQRCTAEVNGGEITLTCTTAGQMWIGHERVMVGNTLENRYITEVPSGASNLSISTDITTSIIVVEANSSKAITKTTYIANSGSVALQSDTRYIALRFTLSGTYAVGNTVTFHAQLELGSTVTDYEPYQKHTYPLSNIELRGIPKLVNNQIQYDGDIYKADGEVTRRFGVAVIDENSPIGQHSAGDTRFYLQKDDMNRRMDYLGYIICDKLQTTRNYAVINENGFVSGYSNSTGYIGQNWIYFSNGEATTIADMKTWLASNPLTVVYELATPTTETTTPYTETQICSPYGTESFVDDRDVQIPVGHKTKYEQIDPINVEITNSGNVPSMPTYRIEGSGSIDVNIDGLHAVTVDMSNINAITINSEEMNAYNDTGGFANRAVTGSYENLALSVGQNTIEIDGDGVIDLLVTNYERWL